MIIFAKKHFGGSKKQFFIGAIHLAVYFRAIIAIANRLVKKLGHPFLEGLFVYGTMYGIMLYWEHYVKYIEGGKYPFEFKIGYMPIYALVFVLFLFISGAYKKPYRLKPLILAPFWAFITIATGTYMFSWVKNFSRAIVGLSAIFTMIQTIAVRGIINKREKGSFFFTEESQKKVIIAAEEKGLERIISLIRGDLEYSVEIVGVVSNSFFQPKNNDTEYLGNFKQIKEIVKFYDVEEVIFCNQSVPTEQILDLMMEVQHMKVEYKIVPPEADYIVGPQAIHTSRFNRQLNYNLQKPEELIKKRFFDMLSSALLLLSYPLLFWLYKKPFTALKKLLKVFTLRYHMVGYINPNPKELPAIKPGLLNMLDRVNEQVPALKVNKDGLDKYYARTYSWDLDLEILLKGWRKIA